MIRAEAQLIEAATRGEAGAVASLLTVCQPDLKRFARRTCLASGYWMKDGAPQPHTIEADQDHVL